MHATRDTSVIIFSKGLGGRVIAALCRYRKFEIVMNIIEKSFWLIAVIVTFVNAYILKSRSQDAIARNPELKEGYEKIFRGYLIYLNIPWVVMGIGILFGGVAGVFDYFNPRTGNPSVLAFHLSVVILWALGVYWIYFRGGAEFLVKHPGLMNIDIKSASALKLIFALMLLGGITALVVMWSGYFPQPHLER